MPIKPENKKLYPPDWEQISARIKERAEGKCEFCGLPNYSIGHRDKAGVFIPLTGNRYANLYGKGLDLSNTPVRFKQASIYLEIHNEQSRIKKFIIVLTTAHLDHDPTNCSDENLKSLCQKCHNNHDAPHRKETRQKTKNLKMDIFGQLRLDF